MNLIDKVAAAASLGLVPAWRWLKERKAAKKKPAPANVVPFPKQEAAAPQGFAPGEPAPSSTRGGLASVLNRALGGGAQGGGAPLVFKPAIVPLEDGPTESFSASPLY